MKNFITLLLLCLAAYATTACTADGEVDAEALKGMFSELKEDFPSKEEFRQKEELRIAKLPRAERDSAYIKLDKALAEWPTDAELAEWESKINESIEEFARKAPTAEETKAMVREAAEQLPTKEELHRAVDKLPENDDIKDLIDSGLDQFFGKMDSLATELKKD